MCLGKYGRLLKSHYLCIFSTPNFNCTVLRITEVTYHQWGIKYNLGVSVKFKTYERRNAQRKREKKKSKEGWKKEVIPALGSGRVSSERAWGPSVPHMSFSPQFYHGLLKIKSGRQLFHGSTFHTVKWAVTKTKEESRSWVVLKPDNSLLQQTEVELSHLRLFQQKGIKRRIRKVNKRVWTRELRTKRPFYSSPCP